MTIKNSKHLKINSVNPLYLVINKVNGYFGEIYENKYLTLVPTNESKGKVKKYEELWSKIRDLMKSITKNSDNYDEIYMKIKSNSDDELPLNKTTEIRSITIVVRVVFHEKILSTRFFRWMSELIITNIKMLYYDRTDVSEGIFVNKTSESKECDIYHYWYLSILPLMFAINAMIY